MAVASGEERHAVGVGGDGIEVGLAKFRGDRFEGAGLADERVLLGIYRDQPPTVTTSWASAIDREPYPSGGASASRTGERESELGAPLALVGGGKGSVVGVGEHRGDGQANP